MPQQQTGTSISGVGKDSQRTDLQGTPGRKGGLSQGKVQEFEQGQQAIENTQGQPPAQPAQTVSEAPAPPQAPPGAGSMPIPDALSFAKKRLGGNLEGAGTVSQTPQDFDKWLPMLRRIAVSPTASGILQRAYVERLSKEMNRPLGGSGAIIRQRKFDDQLRDQ